jgi:hypothetical protein
VSMRKIATMVVTRRMGTFTTWSRLKSRQTGSFARLLLAWSAASPHEGCRDEHRRRPWRFAPLVLI